MDKCIPYNLLELNYLRGRPDCLHITVSDVTSINRPCCVIPKIECAKFNHSSDKNKRKTLKFWLLTLENVDKNSWEKIINGISNLEEIGELLIPTNKILTEKKTKRLPTEYHEDVSENSDDGENSINSEESI